MNFTTYLVDAHHPAMDHADATGLPQVVFYHPDHAYSHTQAFAKVLREKATTQYVCWLPTNYFN